jgi:hypothetical protein
MSLVRLSSTTAPFDTPSVRNAAAHLVLIADGLGLLPVDRPIERIDDELIREIARSSLAEGVAQGAALAILEDTGASTSGARWGALIEHLQDAITGSPMPRRELTGLLRTYGHESLGQLLGISPASLRRYAAGTRAVPDTIAGRIHYVSLVTTDLAGSYNAFGIRRWWERPRAALEGRSPREALGDEWDPNEPAALAVADLARALAGPGAAV